MVALIQVMVMDMLDFEKVFFCWELPEKLNEILVIVNACLQLLTEAKGVKVSLAADVDEDDGVLGLGVLRMVL